MSKKLTSLTIFFPFYNDAGTVRLMITEAYRYGKKVANSLQVIALHGGASSDGTWQEIQKMKKKFPDLKVIDKSDNTEGYGVIKYGLLAAQSQWVFYTDGDAQYRVAELPKLLKRQLDTNADVVNGFKIRRHDVLVRRLLGKIYEKVYFILIRPPIKDIHCDFRLIRRTYLRKIQFETTGVTIIAELVLKLHFLGADFAQVGVFHRKRVYQQSNYHWLRLSFQSCRELFWSLRYVYVS